ncbi:hypothetical protein Tco_0731201 [Tanacetum coccineum]
MCKAYDGEPSVDFFRGVFDLFPGEDWLTFTKRPEADTIVFKIQLCRAARHPANVQTFSDPILFLADLKSSWEHSPQQSACDFCWRKGNGLQEVIVHRFRGSPIREEMTTVASGSVAERMKNRRCMTKGSAKPPMKRKLVNVGSPSRSTRQKSYSTPMESKAESSAFLTISDDDEEVELLDIHDRCYGRQAVVDNAVNQRAQELLRIVDQMKGECGVLREREKAVDKECEELKAKCEAGLADFDKNPIVNVLR